MLKKSRKEYRLKNKEKISEYAKEYYLKNKERIKEHKKEYNLKNREHKKEWQKEWNLRNKEHIKEQKKEYNLKNKERIKEHKKEYYLKNREHYKQSQKEYQKEYLSRPETKELRRNRVNNKYKTDINFRLTDLCRRRLLHALKGNSKTASTMELIGCTIDELRQHIESKFEPWMNWENQGRGGWDVDHIKACFHFNMADPEQQRTCFNWSNLQPMEHIENIKKGTR